MKEKLDLTVISEKFYDAEPQNVHAYPFPNTADCLRAVCHILKLIFCKNRQKGTILIINPQTI
jgi:hypothetical protein